MNNIIYTALFGEHEELKEPKVVTPGWRYIAYTDQPYIDKVWEVVNTEYTGSARMAARGLKILPPFEYDRSIWVDASFWINTDLNEFWDKYFKAPFSAPKHPYRNDIQEEILQVILSGRCDKDILKKQAEAYKDIPRRNGIITSGILMRTPEALPLCQAWWDELIEWSTRDQVAFAKASIGYKFHTYEYNYTQRQEFIYWRHFQYRKQKTA